MLIFMDSFEHYGDFISPYPVKWAGNSGYVRVGAAPTARTGTACLQLGEISVSGTKTYVPANTGIVVGFAFNGNGAGYSTYGYNILEIYEGTTLHLSVAIIPPGKFVVKLGVTVLATGTTIFPGNANWYYLEFKAVINDTTGSYELKIDNTTELIASGIDTRNSGTTGQWDNVKILGTHAANSTFFDDFYLCDTSGATNNTFLGMPKIECLMPQTDAVAVGSNQGLTPSTGTDHGALVDEIPPNTTDYNGSAVVGTKDTYQYPPMSLTGTILAIQANLFAQKSDAGPRQVCAVVRPASTDFDGANLILGTSFFYSTAIFPINPQTGVAWTIADIAALQVGMKVTV